ncbi:choline transporter-like protein 4 [Tachyglossus aculeatus]|uniref:choline transporter-like protein 4 n=1 Tax=Tachyglossus aculeatus TaxID=9261 RepID=UPI0018F2BB52|nr:choline transporter-like protein 4 [Tachyglossus aculeatus]
MGRGKVEEGGGGDEPYGKPHQFDPSFHGPIKKRGCTDVLCYILFMLFIAGYCIVGIVAWVYGDPQQVLYPRNSSGLYCGVGANRDKPNLMYFNIFSCARYTNILTMATNGLQCPTTQICVSSCPQIHWVVLPTDLYKTVSQVFTEKQDFCHPEVDGNMRVIDSLKHELCPSFLLQSSPVASRCIPFANQSTVDLPGISQANISDGIKGLFDTLGARDLSLKIFEDFTHSWYWILIALLISLVLSLVFLLLLQLLAGPLVYVLIVGVLGILAYAIYHCWHEYQWLRDHGTSMADVGFTTDLAAYRSTKEIWLVALIVVAVLEGILVLLLIFLRVRIRIAIALLQEASKAIGQMMSTLFYPLVTFALLIICIAYWAITAVYLATTGKPLYSLSAPNLTEPGCQHIDFNQTCDPRKPIANNSCPGLSCHFLQYNSNGPTQRVLFGLQAYSVLGLFWTVNWVLALGQCVLAGAFASFYWAFHKPKDIPAFPLGASFMRTLRYHTGSLAFGALILTLVQMVRLILEYLDHKLKGAKNSVARCVLCCLKCCFWCLERYIKILNRNAYIMIAIYGKNFCVSARNAFMLLMRNLTRVFVLDKVTDLLLFFGKLLVVGGVGVLSFFFFSNRIPAPSKHLRAPTLNFYWLPMLIVIFGSYLIAHGFFSVFAMCVDTLFLCFLEDLERNDGSLDRPYYMPKSLMQILGKKNQAPKK